MYEVTTAQGAGIAAIVLLLFLILFIWMLRIGARLKRLRKQYTAMMDGSGMQNLEQIIGSLQERVRAQDAAIRQQSEALGKLGQALSQVKGRIGINRYNAFSEQGSDLSFSIAIVNDNSDGVVLSGIHNREQTYVYAKPVSQGESNYTLTPEERQAISQAVQRK